MKLLKFISAFLMIALVTASLLPDPVSASTIVDYAQNYVLDGGGNFIFATLPLLIQFSKQVEKRPRPNNGFLQYAVDESDLVDGSEVRRPVEGNDPVAITNPTQFPLQIEQEDDDQNTYSIALHATKPQRIADDIQIMSNYNIREQIINKHMAVIEHKIAREILFNWSPTVASQLKKTTGATIAAPLGKWGATGTRKAVTKNDIIDAVTILKEDDVDDGTKMLIPVGFEAQLRKIADFIDYQLTGRADMLAKGIIGSIFGCQVMFRSTGLIYDQAGTAPIKPTFVATNNKISTVATSCQGILIWNPNHVYKAFGKIMPYIDPKSGALLGGTVNFAQRAGGSLRKDQMGVVALVEDFVS